MSSHLWALILGLVQGATEFLPISSTAHLKMIPWLFGIDQTLPILSSQAFDIALHAGSAIAILIALWSDWVDLVKGAWARDPFKLRFLGFILVTSIPAAVVGLLFDKKVEALSTPAEFHWAPLLIGVSIIFFGLLLWVADTYAPGTEELTDMTWLRALLVGIAQALALVPGVSRSGATITGGRALGLSRDAIARYSFMVALPIIGGATLVGVKDIVKDPAILTANWLDWVIGFTAALAASVAAMTFMLAWVRKHSFAPFAVYRVAVGLLLIAVFFLRG